MSFSPPTGDLVDNFFNTDRIVVVSEPLRDFLAKKKLSHVEFLPIGIRDKQKKPVKQKHFIVHPTDSIGAVDLDKSKGVEWSCIDDDAIDEIETLVLDTSKIDRPLFRDKHYQDCVFVSRNLANAISNAGFTAIEWKELASR